MYATLTNSKSQSVELGWGFGEPSRDRILRFVIDTSPRDTVSESEPARIWKRVLNSLVLAPIPQSIFHLAVPQVESRARLAAAREPRMFTLAEAGMTKEDASAFRSQLAAFTEGWDEEPDSPRP